MGNEIKRIRIRVVPRSKIDFVSKRMCNFKSISSETEFFFALLLAVVWFAGIVFLAILAVRQPGISIFMITAVLLSVMISVLAAALSHLILKAYELKQENELTI